jgi:hypothetical protein
MEMMSLERFPDTALEPMVLPWLWWETEVGDRGGLEVWN